ncbi:MAG TPA: tRNA 2-selenouridine(34) synthase MnmH [Geobacteraceae bacterium]|nr:tRNA 2-selenouridine(34) synthase MnmH [Geobacteraceae bacterium]
MHTASFNKSFLDTHLIVDVRTPLEFHEDHIPGAINVPLLGNEERIEIGILYKNTGPHEARRRGLELTAPRFPRIVEEIALKACGRPVLVYCWRGGLRSKTVATILDLVGYRSLQLHGGYKSYRNQVVSYFENFTPPGPVVVLHGLTGVGKTSFLETLRGENYTVIDLEALACHRGSAFGALGLDQTISQKRFESILWHALQKSPEDKPVILEGESRRIGRISLPGNMYEVMNRGIRIWCEASIETRVSRLIEEYGRPEYKIDMAAALSRISRKLGGLKYREISDCLENWELEPFMAGLLNCYYDRVYYKTKEWNADLTLSLEDLSAAAVQLDNFLEERLKIQHSKAPLLNQEGEARKGGGGY